MKKSKLIVQATFTVTIPDDQEHLFSQEGLRIIEANCISTDGDIDPVIVSAIKVDKVKFTKGKDV